MKKEKEKSELEELIELLNEFLVQRASGYIHYHSGGEFKRTPTKSAVEGDRMLQDEYVLGKSFGFIKWLVENDKIDRDKKEIEKSDYDITFTGALTKDKKSDLDIMVDTLLMLLSISDTPIEDLISYLR